MIGLTTVVRPDLMIFIVPDINSDLEVTWLSRSPVMALVQVMSLVKVLDQLFSSMSRPWIRGFINLMWIRMYVL